MARPLSPAERLLSEAGKCIAEMSAHRKDVDPRLAAAAVHAEHALGCVAAFVDGKPLTREDETMPPPAAVPTELADTDKDELAPVSGTELSL